MKSLYKLTVLIILAGFAASCSRQIAAIQTDTKLQTVSLPVHKEQASCAEVPPAMAMAQLHDLAAAPRPEVKTVPISTQQVARLHQAISHKSAKEIAKAIVLHAPAFSFVEKHITDRDYPQINKAGFILILAGVLALLFHLILIACIALIVIGLVVLLSPLFRRRY